MATSDERKLSPKAQQFINEYCKDFNGKQAAIRAGYAPRSAEVTASQLLRIPKVAEALKECQGQLRQESGVTAARVVEELARIGFADPRRVFGEDGVLLDPRNFPEDLARAVSSIEVTRTDATKKTPASTTAKIRFWEKPKALHTMAHILGMLKDKVELSGTDGKPIRVSFGGRYRPGDGAAARKR